MFHINEENLSNFSHSSVMERLKSKVTKDLHADRVLVLAPHPDDDVLGCGGVILKLAKGGSHLKCLYIFDGASGNKSGKREPGLVEKREKESIEAAKIMCVSEVSYQRVKEGESAAKIGGRIYEEIKTGHWDLVLFPSELEWHKDHVSVARAALAALGRVKKRPAAWAYNVWGLSVPSVIVPIDNEIKAKIKAAREHKSQQKTKNYEDAVISANRYLGEMFGVGKYAEIYQEL